MKDPKKQPSESTLELIKFISMRYAPAKDFADADITLSTGQILEEIYKHTGDHKITLDYLYQCLLEMGFLYDAIEGGIEFVWLLKNDA